jgi:triacylglycerol esterase/lipase EstA (alpha/beta hydrolase family)
VGKLSRALLLILAVEVGCYAWLGASLVESQGWLAALTAIGAIALALRAVPVLILYAIAWANAGSNPQGSEIGLLARLRYVAFEVGAAIALYTLFQPLAWLLMPRETVARAAAEPILLVHGYLCNRGLWWSFKRWLAAQGRVAYTLDLEPVLGDIDRYADVLDGRIEQITKATGVARVTLIAGSMGGLAARAYLRRFGPQRVARVITLASPHSGSRHAWLALGINGRQMRPESEWLQRLARFEDGRLPVPFVCIYSWHDDMVSPADSGRLAGAQNIALAGVGHLSMAFSRRVRAVVAEHLG